MYSIDLIWGPSLTGTAPEMGGFPEFLTFNECLIGPPNGDHLLLARKLKGASMDGSKLIWLALSREGKLHPHPNHV